MRQADLRHEERATRVDGMHQVVAFHWRIERARQTYCTRIIHDDVDAAKRGDGFIDSRLHLLFKADVACSRQAVPANLVDFLHRRIDGARQSWVRLLGLSSHDYVGPVSRGPERNGQADAATRTRNEQRFSAQG